MSTGDSGRMPALDGVRGLAILLVVARHVFTGTGLFAYGGPVGVTLFFVLSGYLITRLLLAEHARTSGVDLRRFYLRRAARLLPALLLVLAVTPLLVAAAGLDVVLAGLYLMDFAVAAGHAPVTLGHTWSLAVEEQFYLVWPLLLLVLLRRPSSTRLLILLFGSAVLWRVAATGMYGMERVYFAPDTNAYALLAGCLLASLERDGRLPVLSRRIAAGAAGGLVAVSLLPEVPGGLEWSGVVGAALGCVLITAARSLEGGLLVRPVMRWVGQVSYGWYLWHGLLIWLAPGVPGRFLLALVALAVAGLSWRFLEKPALSLVRDTRNAKPGVPARVEYAQ